MIKNSTLEKSSQYTVKLEGVEKMGYRYMAFGGISDPLVLEQLDAFLEDAKKTIQKKIKASLGLEESVYKLQFRIYGDPKAEKAGEIGIVIESLAENRRAVPLHHGDFLAHAAAPPDQGMVRHAEPDRLPVFPHRHLRRHCLQVLPEPRHGAG
jgi:hypothetical protein